MKLLYIGMFDEVIVPDWVDGNGYPGSAKRGNPIDVPDELAARLLEQPANWQEPPATRGRQSEDIAAG